MGFIPLIKDRQVRRTGVSIVSGDRIDKKHCLHTQLPHEPHDPDYEWRIHSFIHQLQPVFTKYRKCKRDNMQLLNDFVY